MGYTELFNKIIAGEIWGESSSTRLVWITMIALKDRKSHRVEVSVSGLARMSHVSPQECEEALMLLSRKNYITKCEEGFLIRDGEEWQRLIDLEKRRTYQKNWARRKRQP